MDKIMVAGAGGFIGGHMVSALKGKGVRGRNSDNTLIKKYLNWQPSIPLRDGMRETYEWIKMQMTEPE
jgi:nucleoside-diphosphate-sugar epimerase